MSKYRNSNLFKIIIITFITTLLLGVSLSLNSMPIAKDIYTQYFNQYNFNSLAKKEVMTELRLLVNYIYYEKAKERNYLELINISKNYANLKLSDSTFNKEIDSLKKSTQDANTTLDNTPLIEESQSCSEFINFIETQKELVTKYDLPYYVQNSSIQVINMRNLLSAKKSLDNSSTNTDQSKKSTNLQEKIELLKSFDWSLGDIILAHKSTGSNHLQGYYNHAGFYSKKSNRVIDAIPNEGVRESNWRYWAENFSDFVILKFDTIESSQREIVESYILSRVNQTYNLDTYKKNEAGGWYCSKLIYMAYKQIGVDLDIKKGLSILPDDLVLSTKHSSLTCFRLER